jgi:hypothetical protein
MTQEEIDLDWSGIVAEKIADELFAAKVVSKADFRRAVAIASHIVHARFVLEDSPDPRGARYRPVNSK